MYTPTNLPVAIKLPAPSILPKHIATSYVLQEFDPRNKEHLWAFRMLTETGRQHSKIRFHLEHPYVDVRAMMYDKVAKAFLADNGVAV